MPRRRSAQAPSVPLETLRSHGTEAICELHAEPQESYVGIATLVYNRGADGARDDYKRTTAAVRRRNWKQAGVEQRDGRESGRATLVQGWFDRAAQQEPFFISHTNCQKPLTQLARR